MAITTAMLLIMLLTAVGNDDDDDDDGGCHHSISVTVVLRLVLLPLMTTGIDRCNSNNSVGSGNGIIA